MGKRFYIDYENTPFLKTSKTLAYPHRLNWRCEILLARNQEAIKDKRVLDLASHDGRFSYACLKLGASHVTGVEGRPHLVKSANENLTSLGYRPDQFSFVKDDVFNYLNKVQPKEFDTILCFGFFYHTVRQSELIQEIVRIQPRYFILDTRIARGVFIERPQRSSYINRDTQPTTPAYLLITLKLVAKLRYLIIITSYFKKFMSAIAHANSGEPCLRFMPESHLLEGATIDILDIVAWPTKSYIEMVLTSQGFDCRQLFWHKKGINDWTSLERYKAGERVSYIAQFIE